MSEIPAYEKQPDTVKCRYCEKWHECDLDGQVQGMCDAERNARGLVVCPNCEATVTEYHQIEDEQFCSFCDPRDREAEREANHQAWNVPESAVLAMLDSWDRWVAGRL